MWGASSRSQATANTLPPTFQTWAPPHCTTWLVAGSDPQKASYWSKVMAQAFSASIAFPRHSKLLSAQPPQNHQRQHRHPGPRAREREAAGEHEGRQAPHQDLRHVAARERQGADPRPAQLAAPDLGEAAPAEAQDGDAVRRRRTAVVAMGRQHGSVASPRDVRGFPAAGYHSPDRGKLRNRRGGACTAARSARPSTAASGPGSGSG